MSNILLIIIALLAIGTITFIVQRQQALKGRNSKELAPKQHTIFDLEIGDIIQHMQVDWVVEGKLTYKIGAYYWFEYLLQDKDKIAWLSVEEDDRVEVALLEPTNQLDVSHTPPQEINFGGDIYKCIDSGTARMKRTGLTMRRTSEKCEYFDYEGTNGRVLSVEIWDGDIEVTVGEKINPRSLLILPGDGRTVYRD
jgi:Domain of unknown function (DUF4178)